MVPTNDLGTEFLQRGEDSLSPGHESSVSRGVEPEPFDSQSVEAVARCYGATLSDMTASPVEIEVRLLRGLLGVVKMIGLREAAAREGKERVRSAIKAAGFRFPDRSLLINLAPAELRKVGPGLDLAIACGILAVSGQIPAESLQRRVLWGELALDGRLRTLRGAIPVALLARQERVEQLVVPTDSAPDVARVGQLPYAGAEDLGEAVGLLLGLKEPRPVQTSTATRDQSEVPWNNIVGQDRAKDAVLTAAAGGHHLLLSGPPGSGKSMLARSLGHLLPDLDEEQSLEVSCIHSAAGLPARIGTRRPPLRGPHCSVTSAGMCGGGLVPRPGEMSLAHHGVLFLDELPHFRREVQDHLRTPLEEGCLVLTRAGRSIRFPSRFLLVAAMNPCPCGNAGEDSAPCSCAPTDILRYRGRITGPVLDRIDLSVRVPFVPAEARVPSSASYSFQEVRERVARVRLRQRERNDGRLNSEIPPRMLPHVATLSRPCQEWLGDRINRLRLSLRAHHRVLRVARTLADLEDSPAIQKKHLLQALANREPSL